MECQIIFIGGVHGVGKTEISRRVAQELHLVHLTASNLIREAGETIEKGVKQVHSVLKNQNALLDALNKYKSTHRPILLDGHFCLLDASGDIQEIPPTTFEQIAPRAMLVLIDEPEMIAERLANRDGSFIKVDFISEFQKRELDHAAKVCHAFNIPLMMHQQSQPVDVMLDFVKRHL